MKEADNDTRLWQRLRGLERICAVKEAAERLEKYKDLPEQIRLDLACMYSRTRRPHLALPHIRRLRRDTDESDHERKAYLLLCMGQLMEQLNDFKAAIRYYKRAFVLKPVDAEVWYLINNNLGFSLSKEGKHQEAEGYCRTAILVDYTRYNAYKNLGIALEGQGQFMEAAQCYVKAVLKNASEPRAMAHLKALVDKHGEVRSVIPNLPYLFAACLDPAPLAPPNPKAAAPAGRKQLQSRRGARRLTGSKKRTKTPHAKRR